MNILFGLARRVSKIREFIRKRFFRYRQVDATSKLIIAPSAFNELLYFRVGPHATVEVGAGARLSGEIEVGEGCSVSFGNDTLLKDVLLRVTNGGKVVLKQGASILSSQCHQPTVVTVDNATLLVGECSVLRTDALVRFGGHLEIGRYTSFSPQTSLRCEELITIGDYCLFALGTVIWDTNTHSTDWQERRKRIEACHPNGLYEISKPLTKPIQIGNHVWSGRESCILKGTEIGDKTIIGIRTIVSSGTYPPESLIVAQKPRTFCRQTT